MTTAVVLGVMCGPTAWADEVIFVPIGSDPNDATGPACERATPHHHVTVQFEQGDHEVSSPIFLGADVTNGFTEVPCQNVTLKGPARLIRRFDAPFPVPTVAFGPAPWQPQPGEVKDVAFEDFTVEGVFPWSAIDVRDLRLVGNDFVGTGVGLVEVFNTHGIMVADNTFTGQDADEAIQLIASTDAVISGNTFTMEGDATRVILLIDAPFADVRDNTVSGTSELDSVIHSEGSDHCVLTGNDLHAFAGPTGAAVRLLDTDHCAATGNDLRNHEQAFLLQSANHTTVTGDDSDPGALVTVDETSTHNAFEMDDGANVCNQGGWTNTFEGDGLVDVCP